MFPPPSAGILIDTKHEGTTKNARRQGAGRDTSTSHCLNNLIINAHNTRRPIQGRTGGGRGVSNGLRREKGRMDANTVRHVAHEQQQLTIFASDESHCLTRTQPESMLSLPVTISARTTTTAVRSGKRTSRNIFFDLSCAQTDRMNLPSLKILPDGCPQANRMATPPGMSCRESPLQSGLNSTR